MNQRLSSKPSYLGAAEVRTASAGRWLSILPILAPQLREACLKAPAHVPCPVHGGKDGLRAFDNIAQTGGMVCNTCGPKKDGFAVLMWINGWDFPQALKEVTNLVGAPDGGPDMGTPRESRKSAPTEEDREEGRERLYKLLGEADNANPKRIAEYFRHRGLAGVVPDRLFFHPSLPYSDGGREFSRLPAILAPICSIDDELVALLRVYLDPEGSGKAEVLSPKKLTKATFKGATRGAAIRLAEPGEVLAVTEGLETGLAVMEATGTPVWVAVSAGGLENIVIPDSVTTLEVWADNDPVENGGTGQKAGMAAADRFARAGGVVKLLIPAQPGTGWLGGF